MLIAVSRRPPLPQRKRAPRCRSALFPNQDPERDGRLLDPVALHPLALHLAGAADGGGAFARALLARLLIVARSDERRFGKACVSTVMFRGAPYLDKKNYKPR